MTFSHIPPQKLKLYAILATVLVIVVIIIVESYTFKTAAEKEAEIPGYLRVSTWQTITVSTEPTIAFQLPETPQEVPVSKDGLKRFIYANEQFIGVGGTLPLNAPAIQGAFNDVIKDEITSSKFAGNALTIDEPGLSFKDITFKGVQGTDFSGNATYQDSEGNAQHVAINGRIILLPHAVFYLYSISAGDLGQKLSQVMLSSLRFVKL